VRLIAFIEYAAVIVGIIGVLAGQFFGLSKGVHLGVFLVGAGIALGGLESLATRRMCFRPSEDAYEAYAGAPALIVGLMVLLVGAGIIAAAYLLADGQWHSTVNYLMRRPAPLLVVAGLLLTGIGVLMMLNPQGRRGWAWTLLVRVPRGLLGFIIVLAGLTGIALGAWEWLEPLAYDRFVASVPRQVERMLE
jgi:vacuolar-type H+-ATPase subunit I/STV1